MRDLWCNRRKGQLPGDDVIHSQIIPPSPIHSLIVMRVRSLRSKCRRGRGGGGVSEGESVPSLWWWPVTLAFQAYHFRFGIGFHTAFLLCASYKNAGHMRGVPTTVSSSSLDYNCKTCDQLSLQSIQASEKQVLLEHSCKWVYRQWRSWGSAYRQTVGCEMERGKGLPAVSTAGWSGLWRCADLATKGERA